jgi:hypothetical protein
MPSPSPSLRRGLNQVSWASFVREFPSPVLSVLSFWKLTARDFISQLMTSTPSTKHGNASQVPAAVGSLTSARVSGLSSSSSLAITFQW